MTSSDTTSIEMYRETGTWYPSVNVKVYPDAAQLAALLPLDLGGYSDDGGETYTAVTSDPGFTPEWIDNLPDDVRQTWWDLACEDGWEEARELARESFVYRGVTVYSAGRSGGHLIVDGLGDVDEWDDDDLTRWENFATGVRAIVDTTTHRWLWNLHANVWETRDEDTDDTDDDEEGAELPEAHAEVIAACVQEAWFNVENGDAHTAADVAADIVQKLTSTYLSGDTKESIA